MDIRILEEAASGKIREQTPEEAEKFMARIRTNLFDLLCHSDKARAEMPVGLDLDEYGGKEAVERALGKAVVNLLALAAVFGVRTGGVILRELGLTSEAGGSVDETEKAPGDNGSFSHTSGGEEAGHGEKKTVSADEHQGPAPASEVDEGKVGDTPEYMQMFDKAGSGEERTAIWKKIQLDRGLDSKTRAELYRYMTALNKQQAAK
ncbi:MAG: hypothetical protein M0Z67_02550 [Nitrospiraceae bacterium]|nr:hypothetical protein [Nitrospiraceae bacterium]